MEADNLLNALRARSPRLGGRRPTSLKAAAIRYLAKERDLPVTLHKLILVYGVSENAIIPNEKLIRKVVQEINVSKLELLPRRSIAYKAPLQHPFRA